MRTLLLLGLVAFLAFTDARSKEKPAKDEANEDQPVLPPLPPSKPKIIVDKIEDMTGKGKGRLSGDKKKESVGPKGKKDEKKLKKNKKDIKKKAEKKTEKKDIKNSTEKDTKKDKKDKKNEKKDKKKADKKAEKKRKDKKKKGEKGKKKGGKEEPLPVPPRPPMPPMPSVPLPPHPGRCFDQVPECKKLKTVCDLDDFEERSRQNKPRGRFGPGEKVRRAKREALHIDVNLNLGGSKLHRSYSQCHSHKDACDEYKDLRKATRRVVERLCPKSCKACKKARKRGGGKVTLEQFLDLMKNSQD